MSTAHSEPGEYHDTARSLYLAECVKDGCGGAGKLVPDGNQWEVACRTCGATAASAGSPAIAAKNWNTLACQELFAKPEECA